MEVERYEVNLIELKCNRSDPSGYIRRVLKSINYACIVLFSCMNLIGNTCVASYITRDFLKQQFSNPFCWNIIDYDSMYYLINHWSEIDFLNFTIEKDDKWNLSIIIDGNVKVQYIHYHFDRNCVSPKVRGNDVYYNKIWEFCVDKYKSRVKRMLETDEEPIFILVWPNQAKSKRGYYTRDQIDTLTQSKYRVITSFDYSDDVIVDNFQSIHQPKKFIDNGLPFAKYIYEHGNLFNTQYTI